MRRKPLLIALTAAVALVGAGVAGIASAASSGAAVTFTTLGRDGSKVAGHITLESSPDNIRQYTLGTGKKYTIAKGTYAMMTDIYNQADGTDTMAGRIVKVTGTTAITFDARLGKAVHADMTGVPAGYEQQFRDIRVCNDPDGFAYTEAYSSPGRLYVIPDSNKLLQFAFLTTWSDPANPAADQYAAVASIAGLPGKPNWTFHGSTTAALKMTALSGPQAGSNVDMVLQPQGHSCILDMWAEMASGPAPLSTTVHVNPATWDLRLDESAENGDVIGNFDSIRKVTAGQSVSQYYFRGAWGPAQVVPAVRSRQIEFDTTDMFKDPGFASSLSGEASEKSTVTLKLKGKTLTTAHTTDWGGQYSDFMYRLPQAGWYSLTVDAVRYHPGITYPAGMLSPKSSVSFNFHADPAADSLAPLWTTRFVPLSLSRENAAKPGTVTTVDLFFDRNPSSSDQRVTPAATLHAISAQASYDEGKTWHTVGVKKSGTQWVALVTNPAAAGSVSLRATTTEKATGANATTTVIRAYAVN